MGDHVCFSVCKHGTSRIPIAKLKPASLWGENSTACNTTIKPFVRQKSTSCDARSYFIAHAALLRRQASDLVVYFIAALEGFTFLAAGPLPEGLTVDIRVVNNGLFMRKIQGSKDVTVKCSEGDDDASCKGWRLVGGNNGIVLFGGLPTAGYCVDVSIAEGTGQIQTASFHSRDENTLAYVRVGRSVRLCSRLCSVNTSKEVCATSAAGELNPEDSPFDISQGAGKGAGGRDGPSASSSAIASAENDADFDFPVWLIVVIGAVGMVLIIAALIILRFKLGARSSRNSTSHGNANIELSTPHTNALHIDKEKAQWTKHFHPASNRYYESDGFSSIYMRLGGLTRIREYVIREYE